MINNLDSNKKIAKNTIILYVRMLFAMLVSLYTSRIVLDYLGEQDYGIQNVVGGIVTMFAFLSNTLASASQRYFAFELGRGNINRLKKIFSLTILLYLIIIVIIVVLAETVGLWFINEKMLIPADRLYAANWLFQISIISFCVTIYATPYQAIIIARERMDVYAIVGILDAVLHLLFVLFIQYYVHNYDSLIMYGFVMLIYKCVCQAIYIYFSRSKFEESSFLFFWDASLAKEMFSYSFWNVFGSIANICRSQGVNMLISFFFVPVVNAAYAVAYQVNNALNVFAMNFYTAVRPQVTKRYAAGDIKSTMSLVYISSKFTYFLLAFVSIPMLVFVNSIMEIWLVKPPELAPLFTRLVIIIALVDSLSNPLMTLMQATGNVKFYQIVTGGLILLNLPISWLFLDLGYSADYTLLVAIVIAILSLISRLFIVKRYINFPIVLYLRKVLLKIFLVSIFSYCSCLFISILTSNSESVLSTILSFCLSVAITIAFILYLGLERSERYSITSLIVKKGHVLCEKIKVKL
jgi:O-antigen/teichoic acid export membrane protein